MECSLKLTCSNTDIVIKLNNELQDMTHFAIEKCITVHEDDWYKAAVYFDNESLPLLSRIDFRVNGSIVGKIDVHSFVTESWNQCIFYKEDNSGLFTDRKKLFLLCYDLVYVSIDIYKIDGTCISLFSDYLLCLTRNEEDAQNINDILMQLSEFRNSRIYEWIFDEINTPRALQLSSWVKHSYRSLQSYISLLEEITMAYREGLLYFRYHAKENVSKTLTNKNYREIRQFHSRDYKRVLRHSGNLSLVNQQIGINYK